MYSLDGNPQNFINAVLNHKKKEISKAEAVLAKLKNEVITINHEYRGYIADYAVGDLYCHTEFLEFHITEDNRAVGTVIPQVKIAPQKIYTLYSGKDFVKAIDAGEITSSTGQICMIYVTGKATNLVIEGYSYDSNKVKNICKVSLDKFKLICAKSRVEINFKAVGKASL
jgi:hypothetical protein